MTSVNDKGEFDVLEKHINFVTLIKEKIIIHTTDGRVEEMKIKEGVLRVHKDEVSIFLGLAFG